MSKFVLHDCLFRYCVVLQGVEGAMALSKTSRRTAIARIIARIIGKEMNPEGACRLIVVMK